MFNAKFEDGTTISVIDRWHLKELKELRKNRSFHCPMCNEPVMLKLGEKRQWHFAHKANSGCLQLYERETEYHMNGKKQLYEWLKQQQMEVALEVYLPLIRQRPDILFRHNKTLYAIEYQCAPIQPKILEKRTNGYQQIGIIPLWILGGNRLKRHSRKSFSLKSFEWYATRKNALNKHILTYYCPDQKKIAHLQQLTPYSSTRLLATYQEHPVQSLELPSLLQPPNEAKLPFDYWLTVKKQWRFQHPSPYPSRTDTFLQQILYQKNIPPSHFPVEAGWPTDHHYLIEAPSYQWQTFLLLESIQHQPLFQSFSSRIIKQCLQPYINKGIFSHRQMIDNLDWSKAVDGFLDWLCKIGYLEIVNDHELYKRIRSVTIPTSTEQAIDLDRKYLYNTLGEVEAIK